MVINPFLLISSIKLSIILVLLASIFFFSKSFIYRRQKIAPSNQRTIVGITASWTPESKTSAHRPGPFMIKVLKTLATLSILSLIISLYSEFQRIKITFSLWLSKTPTKISLNFLYDQYFLVFLTVALIVTWSIIEFSYYYMSEDPKSTAFFRLLTIFLLNMLILTCSNRLFLIFLGWEGVGFLSFLLISWWTTRKDARGAALEAVIYNRIGDIGLILFMALSILLFNSWNLKEIIRQNNPYSPLLPFMLFGLVLAAAGKSAQFGLHPWLPAAMEGPTPVSALLHRSTMVVAGVFLLIRSESLFSKTPSAQTVVLLLGGITALFAASTAITQHDIKKIIAYSTTRQLGLMVTSIGLGQPLLALFHICTHAFFKAMLFLCSGRVIHSLRDEQDLRKMSGLSNLLPVTSACLILGRLALMGTPFLAGFYSKDLILEAAGASLAKSLGLLLRLIATLLTAVYRFRIILFCFLSNPTVHPLTPVREENSNLTKALIRLSLGTIVSGWFFSKFVFASPTLIIPRLVKSLPLIVTVTGVVLLLTFLAFLTTTSINRNVHRALTLQWFFTDLLHRITTLVSFASSLFFSSRTMDRGWQEKIGPQGIGKLSLAISKTNQTTQRGLIKRYISSSVILIIIIVLLSYVITS